MTEVTAWSTGMIWLGRATSPIAIATAEMPSSSGMPAATSAPKAITRMISVIGTEVTSALAKSFENAFSSDLLALAEPNSSIRRFGCRCAALATAVSIGPMRCLALSESPATEKVTRADRPSLEICPWLRGSSGDLTSDTVRKPDTAPMTSPTADLICGLDGFSDPDRVWIRMFSSPFLGKLSLTICWAERDCPVPWSSSLRLFVPTAPPMARESTTSASHPKIAVLRCVELQRPARAARFLDCISSYLLGRDQVHDDRCSPSPCALWGIPPKRWWGYPQPVGSDPPSGPWVHSSHSCCRT